jgi:hypothetical protein
MTNAAYNEPKHIKIASVGGSVGLLPQLFVPPLHLFESLLFVLGNFDVPFPQFKHVSSERAVRVEGTGDPLELGRNLLLEVVDFLVVDENPTVPLSLNSGQRDALLVLPRAQFLFRGQELPHERLADPKELSAQEVRGLAFEVEHSPFQVVDVVGYLGHEAVFWVHDVGYINQQLHTP